MILFLLTKPLGLYLTQVLETDGKTFLDPVLKPIERLLYRFLRVDPMKEQNWKEYTFSLLAFNLIAALLTYGILRLQHLLPLNPEHLGPVADHLAFNTAVSFVTQTNWQSYGGETTMSYFSQMIGLTLQNFISCAVALAVAAALVRGIASKRETVGNFWATTIRSILYLLIPLSLLLSLLLVSQGMIQNFHSYTEAHTLEASTQTIAQGPMASQVAIKMLGSNGGGFTGANASHPYENPTPLSNFLQVLAILALPCAMTYYLGKMVKDQKHGWAVWNAMLLLFLAGVLICWHAESVGNPHFKLLGIESGNMEGKEVRFGIFNSSLWATATSATSCGAVNSMHDSYTPMGGLIPMLNILLGCLIFGGTGAGLYALIIYVVLTIFLGGLMVGRVPKYLGNKIEAYDIKACMAYVIVSAFGILVFTCWGALSSWGLAGLKNAGPHGFSEILYAYAEANSNNGSAFAGLTTNTSWYNTTLGIAILIGRYLMIVPVMALAGNLASKPRYAFTAASLPITTLTFSLFLAGVIVIIGALIFFPALSIGPILEYFIMNYTNILY